jgi:acyl-CoA thioesterase FadM
MEYALSRVDAAGAELVARAATEHAMVDTSGRVRRIPEAQRRAMAGIAMARAAGTP